MKEDELRVLKDISRKLDQLILLLKISNRKTLEEFKKEVRGDKVSAKIIELADGTITYSELSRRVAEEMKVSEITVKRKISSLREMGFLVARREGREVYYENSGLYD